MQDKIFTIQNKEEFEAIALELFNYQIAYNKTYATYARALLNGKIPRNIYEIPFLPISFFKTDQVICQEKPIEKIAPVTKQAPRSCSLN